MISSLKVSFTNSCCHCLECGSTLLGVPIFIGAVFATSALLTNSWLMV